LSNKWHEIYFIGSDYQMGRFPRPISPKKLTTKDILRLLQILFHIPSNRSMGLVEQIFGICRNCSRLELYDVTFGGIERMTKRLTIALVALALFVLVVMVPVSATKVSTGPNYYYEVTRNIAAGSTIFIGEEKLNLAFAENTVVGYWASAAARGSTPASKTVTLTSVTNYTVTAADYGIGGSIADWYVVDGSGFGTTLAFRAADPSLDVTVWAPDIAADVTGKSVTKGTNLQFGIVTNQYAALTSPRVPVGTSTADGYINLNVRTESGAVLSQLFTSSTTYAPLQRINVTTQPYYWGTFALDNATVNSTGVAPTWSWDTAATINGQPQYAPGTYTIWADSLLNNMKSRYVDAVQHTPERQPLR
jgi:hypothetical protein